MKKLLSLFVGKHFFSTIWFSTFKCGPSYSVVLGKMEFVPSMILKIEFNLFQQDKIWIIAFFHKPNLLFEY